MESREQMDRSEAPLRVLGLAGSLRRQSYNRRLLEAVRELAPPSATVEIFDLGDVPLYNGDVDTDAERPESVVALRRAIAASDALVIATPEYNHNIPGVLQNAIDWASRPAMKSPLAGKPVGIMGASPGVLGAVRAQQQLKLVLMATLAAVLPHPGVLVGQAGEKFDPAGRLTHAPTRAFLEAFLHDLEAWARRVGRPAEHAAAGTQDYRARVAA